MRRSPATRRDAPAEEEDRQPGYWSCGEGAHAFEEGPQASAGRQYEDLPRCVHDQEGKCGLLISVSSLTWEINQACGLADDTDKGFKRHDPMCAARPLRTPFVEEGCRLVDSMFEEDTDGKDQG